MTTLRLTLSVALLLLCFGQASALTIREYQESKSSSQDIRDLTTAYISGMGAAYTWTNSELERDRRPLLLCQPRTLALRADLLAQLLDREVQNTLYMPEHPIEVALLFALKRAFPCN